MSETRSVKIGKCTLVFTNVPDDISEDELKTVAWMKLFQMNKDKAIEEMKGFGKAS